MLSLMVYTACALDTEGCIRIARYKQKKAYVSYRGWVEVSQTSLSWLEHFRAIWGGSVAPAFKKNRKNWSPCWIWTIADRGALNLLQCIRPYLRLKAAQADLVLELCTRVSNNIGRPRKGRSFKTTPEELIYRQALYERCKLLNKRGPKTPEQLSLILS